MNESTVRDELQFSEVVQLRDTLKQLLIFELTIDNILIDFVFKALIEVLQRVRIGVHCVRVSKNNKKT